MTITPEPARRKPENERGTPEPSLSTSGMIVVHRHDEELEKEGHIVLGNHHYDDTRLLYPEADPKTGGKPELATNDLRQMRIRLTMNNLGQVFVERHPHTSIPRELRLIGTMPVQRLGLTQCADFLSVQEPAPLSWFRKTLARVEHISRLAQNREVRSSMTQPATTRAEATGKNETEPTPISPEAVNEAEQIPPGTVNEETKETDTGKGQLPSETGEKAPEKEQPTSTNGTQDGLQNIIAQAWAQAEGQRYMDGSDLEDAVFLVAEELALLSGVKLESSFHHIKLKKDYQITAQQRSHSASGQREGFTVRKNHGDTYNTAVIAGCTRAKAGPGLRDTENPSRISWWETGDGDQIEWVLSGLRANVARFIEEQG